MPSKDFLLTLLSVYGLPWLITSAAGIIVAIILAIAIEPLWLVGGLLWVCFIIPLMMIFMYIFHGMKPTNVFNMADHTLSFLKDKVQVNVFREEDKTYHFPLFYKDFSHITLKNRSILMRFLGEKEGFIFLPLSAFGAEEIFHEKLEVILNLIRSYKGSQMALTE